MTSVLVFPGDNGACGQYRLALPAQAADTLTDLDVQIAADGVDDFPIVASHIPWRGHTIRKVHTMSGIPDVDVIVIQRAFGDTTWQFIEHFQAKGIRVVLDLDDDFYHLHPSNPVIQSIAATNGRLHVDFLRESLRRADHVTVTTPALAALYGKVTDRPVTVIPNYVPAWYLDIPHDPTSTVGWSGSLAVHAHDVPELRGAFGQLQRDGRQIRIVGHAAGRPGGLGRAFNVDEHADTFTTTGRVEFHRWPYEITNIGVGAVPLQLSPFNHGKSWLKGLEYAALDVPFVASPTDPYRAFHTDGFGTLVEKPKQWTRALKFVDPESGQRERIRRCGYTIEDQVHQWANVWGNP